MKFTINWILLLREKLQQPLDSAFMLLNIRVQQLQFSCFMLRMFVELNDFFLWLPWRIFFFPQLKDKRKSFSQVLSNEQHTVYISLITRFSAYPTKSISYFTSSAKVSNSSYLNFESFYLFSPSREKSHKSFYGFCEN